MSVQSQAVKKNGKSQRKKPQEKDFLTQRFFSCCQYSCLPLCGWQRFYDFNPHVKKNKEKKEKEKHNRLPGPHSLVTVKGCCVISGAPNATNVWAPVGRGTASTVFNQRGLSGAKSSSDSVGEQTGESACEWKRERGRRPCDCAGQVFRMTAFFL